MSGLGGIGSGGVVYPRQAEGPGGSDASPAAAAHADCGSSAPARAAAGSGGRAAILTNLEKQATRLAPPDPGVAYNPSRDARTLHEAMKGLGTDEEAVFSILESRTPEQLQELEAHFAKSYSKKWGSLRLALHRDFSGDELERALGGLDRGRPALGGEAFERILDAETGSVARPGTSVEMLFDGVTSFEKRYELIAGAKTSINLQTFYFGDDNTGWKTARALADAAGRGVKVRVVYDAWASGKVDPAVFKHMREAGVEVAAYGDPFKEPLKINSRWHEKVLVVDGGAAILGGMNIGDEYALGGTSVSSVPNAFGHEGPPWRDTDVLIQGPAVADAQRAFLKNWSDLGRSVSEADRNALFPELAELPDGEGVRFVQHRPADDGDDNTKALYLQAIRSAKKSIRIENAYLVPPPEIKAALIDAARRGVKVEMLTNGEDSVDVKLLVHTGRYHYDDLVEAGVKIYETQGGTLHSKTAIFDDQLTIVGSANLNGRSDGRDSESVVLAYDPGTAATNAARFGRGVSKATEVTAADLEEDSAWDNLKQWGLALFSWTI